MSCVRDRTYQLVSPEEVDTFIEHYPTCAIFKAGSCHKTMQGFAHVEEVLNGYPQVRMGYIQVVEHRHASNRVAEITGVQHESPQLILFISGRACFDCDNWEITPDRLEAGLTQHLGSAVEGGRAPASDMSIYAGLLEQFLAGDLSQDELRREWVVTFKGDVTPRSAEEVSLLQDLFGEISCSMDQLHDPALDERARGLLDRLRSLYTSSS